MNITDQQIDQYRLLLSKLTNKAQYNKAYILSRKLMKKHPHVIIFEYYEAVMTAEDDVNFSKIQVKVRYKQAAQKLRRILRRTRGVSDDLKGGIQNEYYWFSNQPYKQYRLGLLEASKGNKRGGYYSQGVGAVQLAKAYAEKRKKKLALKWARKSEKAWLNFFKINSKWHNSYLFYARALGYQGRIDESHRALLMAAKFAGKSRTWKVVRATENEISDVLKDYQVPIQ